MKRVPLHTILFYSASVVLLAGTVVIIHSVRNDGQPPAFILTFLPLVFWVFVGLMIVQVVRKIKIGKQDFADLAANIHPDEKIRMLDERYRKGVYKSSEWMFFNHLSIVYEQKGDYVRALDLVQRAYAILPDKRLSQWGSALSAGIIKNNEASYLIDMGYFDAAEQLLVMLECEGIKNPSFRAAHLENRARLALYRGDIASARSYIATGRALVEAKKQPHFLSGFLLIEAKCDLAEGNVGVVRDKLDTIIAQCTYAPTVWEAERMKQTIPGGGERTDNGER